MTVKEEEDDDMPPQLRAAELVPRHPAFSKLFLFVEKGRKGLLTCGFDMILVGGWYVVARGGGLTTCEARATAPGNKCASKLLTVRLAELKMPGVDRATAVRSENKWSRMAATVLEQVQGDMIPEFVAGIQDEAHLHSICGLAPSAVAVTHADGGIVGESSLGPAGSLSLPSTPLQMRGGTPPKQDFIQDSPLPTQLCDEHDDSPLRDNASTHPHLAPDAVSTIPTSSRGVLERPL